MSNKNSTKANSNGTQLVRPKVNQRQNNMNKPATQVKKESRIPAVGGVRIGDNTDKDKWRCRTCKHLNGIQFDECQTCQDPRPGFKPKPKVQEKKE